MIRVIFISLFILVLICLGIGMLLSYAYDYIEEYVDKQRQEDEEK